MKCGPAANKFGEFLVKNLWDAAIEHFDNLARGQWRAPSIQPLQRDLASLSPEQIEIVRRCVGESISSGMHQFLFALGEGHDFDKGIAVVVDGVDIVEQSDGLHGETFGPDGWIAKFSKHPEPYPNP